MYTLLDELDIEMVVRDRPLKFNNFKDLVEETNRRMDAYMKKGLRVRFFSMGVGLGFYVIREVE